MHNSFADHTASELAWRERYAKAVSRLQRAGIPTVEDEHADAERYVTLRREWDADVQTLSRSMRLDLHEIDFAMARAQSAYAVLHCSTDQADQGYAALNDIRELSALRIAVSVLCLCSAISIAAFNSGTV